MVILKGIDDEIRQAQEALHTASPAEKEALEARIMSLRNNVRPPAEDDLAMARAALAACDDSSGQIQAYRAARAARQRSRQIPLRLPV